MKCPDCGTKMNPNMYGYYCVKCRMQHPRDVDHWDRKRGDTDGETE